MWACGGRAELLEHADAIGLAARTRAECCTCRQRKSGQRTVVMCQAIDRNEYCGDEPSNPKVARKLHFHTSWSKAISRGELGGDLLTSEVAECCARVTSGADFPSPPAISGVPDLSRALAGRTPAKGTAGEVQGSDFGSRASSVERRKTRQQSQGSQKAPQQRTRMYHRLCKRPRGGKPPLDRLSAVGGDGACHRQDRSVLCAPCAMRMPQRLGRGPYAAWRELFSTWLLVSTVAHRLTATARFATGVVGQARRVARAYCLVGLAQLCGRGCQCCPRRDPIGVADEARSPGPLHSLARVVSKGVWLCTRACGRGTCAKDVG